LPRQVQLPKAQPSNVCSQGHPQTRLDRPPVVQTQRKRRPARSFDVNDSIRKKIKLADHQDLRIHKSASLRRAESLKTPVNADTEVSVVGLRTWVGHMQRTVY